MFLNMNAQIQLKIIWLAIQNQFFALIFKAFKIQIKDSEEKSISNLRTADPPALLCTALQKTEI